MPVHSSRLLPPQHCPRLPNKELNPQIPLITGPSDFPHYILFQGPSHTRTIPAKIPRPALPRTQF